MSRIGSRFVAVLGVLAAACGGNDPSDECAAIALEVTPQAPDPVFDWTSQCPAALLEVTLADSAEVFLWSAAAAPGVNAIRGPVIYGVAPTGAAVSQPPSPLESGRQYRLQISRTVEILGFEPMGSAFFNLP